MTWAVGFVIVGPMRLAAFYPNSATARALSPAVMDLEFFWVWCGEGLMASILDK
jgi:hypothetical protein